MYRAWPREGAAVAAATTETREDLRRELRGALVAYLERHDGEALSADAVRDVAREYNVDRSHVANAMWALVGDGEAVYGAEAELSLKDS
jgi:hypothetical protein